ncbi:unnamed protein product [Oppiella nova]|uniref:Uncharacterized protein n=1 Tax=Oppiella nova TaxID=334625 RepID=A0A7R9MBB8_9ACAR|nr:unnamed protein product [Oppiella nova]CAG2172947.1 unnamed protein product [Oppiella nova]
MSTPNILYYWMCIRKRVLRYWGWATRPLTMPSY